MVCSIEIRRRDGTFCEYEEFCGSQLVAIFRDIIVRALDENHI
jgi:hypothetical protein